MCQTQGGTGEVRSQQELRPNRSRIVSVTGVGASASEMCIEHPIHMSCVSTLNAAASVYASAAAAGDTAAGDAVAGDAAATSSSRASSSS